MTPEIKCNIEAVEQRKALQKLAALEVEEGFAPLDATGKASFLLEIGGALVIGVMLGVFAAVFNFMFFVWLFHIELL